MVLSRQMILTKKSSLLLCYVVFLLLSKNGGGTVANNLKEEEEEVIVSPECAAILLVSGGAVGGAATYALMTPILAMLGFTSTGVMGGSIASWWQSTMPAGVASGSIFASLQSIAMAGTGSGTIMVGTAFGGTTGAIYLNQICSMIDSQEKNSNAGKAIQSVLVAVQKTSTATEWVSSYSYSLLGKMERAGKSAFDAGKKTLLKTEIALIDREIVSRKQQFGIEFYDMIIEEKNDNSEDDNGNGNEVVSPALENEVVSPALENSREMAQECIASAYNDIRDLQMKREHKLLEIAKLESESEL